MRDSSPPDHLERRYRHLMRAYPPSYRRAREDEIVGVLLECAVPGQTRPTWAERWDVMRGGLRAWWTASPSGPVSSRWLDAATALAVALPLMFAINAYIGVGNVVTTWIDHPGLERSLPARSILVGLVGWTTVSVNILRTRWRSAAYAAIVTTVVSLGFDFTAHLFVTPDEALADRLFGLLPTAILFGFVAVMLARNGAGDQGRRLLGQPLLLVTAAALSFGSNALVNHVSDDFRPGTTSSPLYQTLIAVVAVVFIGTAIALLFRVRCAATTRAVLTVAAVAFVSPVTYFARLHWLGDPAVTSSGQALAIIAIPIAIALFSPVSRHGAADAERSTAGRQGSSR